MIYHSTNIPFLNKALDAYSLRQQVIADNIANVTTIGYKSKHVSFEEQLDTALGKKSLPVIRTHYNHIPYGCPAPDDGGAKIVEDDADNYISGVNNVDFDHQMSELAKNQIRFKFSTKMVQDIFRGLQKSIKGTL